MAEKLNNQEIVEQEEEPKKGKLKLISLIGILVICMGAGGMYYFFGDTLMQKYFGARPKIAEKKKEKVIGPILSLEPFLFNISGSSSKFGKISIGVELKDSKILGEAKIMMPVVRDKTLSVLGSKTPEMLMDMNGRKAIKEELYNALKTLFKNQGDLNAVYITDIIIQ